MSSISYCTYLLVYKGIRCWPQLCSQTFSKFQKIMRVFQLNKSPCSYFRTMGDSCHEVQKKCLCPLVHWSGCYAEALPDQSNRFGQNSVLIARLAGKKWQFIHIKWDTDARKQISKNGPNFAIKIGFVISFFLYGNCNLNNSDGISSEYVMINTTQTTLFMQLQKMVHRATPG